MFVLIPGLSLALEVGLPASTPPASPFDVVASWVDVGAPATYEPSAAVAHVTDAAPATIIGTPGANLARQIKGLTVHNPNAAPYIARVYLDDGSSVETTLVEVTLQPGSSLVYTDGAGFRVLTSDGEIVQTSTP